MQSEVLKYKNDQETAEEQSDIRVPPSALFITAHCVRTPLRPFIRQNRHGSGAFRLPPAALSSHSLSSSFTPLPLVKRMKLAATHLDISANWF